MKRKDSKHRILILGASGFIGNAIYNELCGYFNTFGTYFTENKVFEKNHHFFQFNAEEDDVHEILKVVKPTIIVSTLRGNFSAQVIAHNHIIEYIKKEQCKLIFLSSANVFDAYSKYPSYENDKTLSNSIYGHFKIKIETALMRLPKRKWTILRLPMVFGSQSPRIKEVKQQIKDKEPIEVFPNLVMNVNTDTKLTQQIHYIINRNKSGIFHLGSTDLVHHDDFIKDVITSLGYKKALLKKVYTTNNQRYLAVLPKDKKLPKHLQITSQELLNELEV